MHQDLRFGGRVDGPLLGAVLTLPAVNYEPTLDTGPCQVRRTLVTRYMAPRGREALVTAGAHAVK
jgi:hypothetical protein